MIIKDKSEEFYSRFYEQLKNSQKWPSEFLFKFIIKKDSTDLEKLKSFFAGKEITITIKNSKKETYQSLSIVVHMSSPDEVIGVYKKVGKLENVISL